MTQNFWTVRDAEASQRINSIAAKIAAKNWLYDTYGFMGFCPVLWGQE